MKIKEYSELFFRDSSKHEGIEPDISNIWLNAITALFSTFWKNFSMRSKILFPEKTLNWRKEKMFVGFYLRALVFFFFLMHKVIFLVKNSI
jgi:hypothetical protein